MRCLGLLLFLVAEEGARADMAARDRLVGAVRGAVAAGKFDEALDLLKDGRASAQDDFLAAGLCLMARRTDAARAEIRRAIDRGPVDAFDIGTELALVTDPAAARATLEREEARKILVGLLGEGGAAQALLGVDGRKIRNSVGMELVRIRPGRFPVRRKSLFRTREVEVTLTKPFFLGATEVTQAQWKAVMGGNPSRFQGDDLPVHCVSWDDAVGFCKKLSENEGKEYRLPTEAEWEYACRAGAPVFTPYGPLHEVAWTSGNSYSWRGGLRESPQPVGLKKPNEWGLYDMLGNVLEWCGDGPGGFPAALVDPAGPVDDGKDARRPLRGGSWNYMDKRFFNPDSRFDGARSNRGDGDGLRVVRAP